MRTFLSIRLGPTSVEPLVAAQTRLEKSAPDVYKWSSLDGIHLTLYFLGDTDEAALGSVTTRLNLLQFPPFDLGWGGLVTLPSADVPKILAVGVCGNVDHLRSLQRKVHDVCFPFAENKETRAYFPHATIGRLKRGIPPSAKIVKRALTDFLIPDGPVETVSRFELVQSTLTPEGSQYATLKTFPLESPA